MSNGTTDVVLSVLCLAGADIAGSRWEKQLLVWLAGHDQTVRGRGCAFFDLDDLGWSKDDFSRQRHFVFRLLDRAKGHVGWEKLDWTPSAEIVEETLERLRRLVGQYAPDYIEEGADRDWSAETEAGFEKCPRHGIYLHDHGCVICNDG